MWTLWRSKGRPIQLAMRWSDEQAAAWWRQHIAKVDVATVISAAPDILPEAATGKLISVKLDLHP